MKQRLKEVSTQLYSMDLYERLGLQEGYTLRDLRDKYARLNDVVKPEYDATEKQMNNLSEAYLTLLTRTIFETKEFEMGEIHVLVTDYILQHTIESEALSWVLYRGYLKYVKNGDFGSSSIFSSFIGTQKSHLALSNATNNHGRSFIPNRSEKLNDAIIEKDVVDYWADFQVWYGKVPLELTR